MLNFIYNKLRTIKSFVSLFLISPKYLITLYRVKRERITLLGLGALLDLALTIKSIERKKVPGILVEAGSALGGSAILITSIKQKERTFALYDTFEMIPSPGEFDGPDAQQRYELIKSGQAKGISGDSYYGYINDLYTKVQKSFSKSGFPVAENRVVMYKGLIENTMNINQPVAAAHIDCDWYSPVLVCLQQIVPHLSLGGVLVVDDYYQWSGARKAVDEYFANKKNKFLFTKKSRLHIQRVELD